MSAWETVIGGGSTWRLLQDKGKSLSFRKKRGEKEGIGSQMYLVSINVVSVIGIWTTP